ncbi:MAG TPA: hypothetical protein VFY89_10320 [Ktedonobacterales bacterium]
MSKTIQVTDEQYETITRAAASRGTTPEAVLAQLIEGLRDPLTQPRYYEMEDWFRHLGMSDDEITDIKREAEADGDADA